MYHQRKTFASSRDIRPKLLTVRSPKSRFFDEISRSGAVRNPKERTESAVRSLFFVPANSCDRIFGSRRRMFFRRFLAEPQPIGEKSDEKSASESVEIVENRPPSIRRIPDCPVSSRAFAPIFSLFPVVSRPIRGVFTFPSDLRRWKTEGKNGKTGRPSGEIFPLCPPVRAPCGLDTRFCLRKMSRIYRMV